VRLLVARKRNEKSDVEKLAGEIVWQQQKEEGAAVRKNQIPIKMGREAKQSISSLIDFNKQEMQEI